MNRRTAQKARTRETILDAAASLFTANGFAGAATADIATAAGVSHGLVFAHFATREELVGAVIDRFAEMVGTRLHAAVGSQMSLRGVLAAHLGCIGEFEPLYARLVAEAHLLPEGARKRLIGVQSIVSHHLYQVAEKEMRLGRIKRVENDLLFNTWLGLVHHYLLNRSLFAPGGSVTDALGERLCSHFMQLLATDRKEVRNVTKKVHRLRDADGKG